MPLNKTRIEIPSLEVFNRLKRATDSTNTTYVIGEDPTVIYGTPDIKWEQVAYIIDKGLIYARGSFYNAIDDANVSELTTWSSQKIQESLNGGLIDLCEYPDGTTDKAQYIFNHYLNGEYPGQINDSRVIKVIKKEEILSNSFTFGGFPAEMRFYEYNDIKRFVFKITMTGEKRHPDLEGNIPNILYLVYFVAWEDSDEWKVGDLVFNKKYSTNLPSTSFNAPRYISRLFTEGYDYKDIKRKIKSEITRLSKDVKAGMPGKASIQEALVYNGETVLLCRRSSFRHPLIIFNHLGEFYNADGSQFQAPSEKQARNWHGVAVVNGEDETGFVLDGYVYLEKYSTEISHHLDDDKFYCSTPIGGFSSIREFEMPYVFLKVPAYRSEQFPEGIFQGDGGGIIAVHIDNIINNQIQHLYHTPGTKYKIFVPVSLDQYQGLVIKNTNRNLAASNEGSISIVRAYYSLHAGAYICNKHQDEFVRVKKGHLFVNPWTNDRYTDPDTIISPWYNWRKIFRDQHALTKRSDDNVKISNNMTLNSVWFKPSDLARLLTDRLNYTSYVREARNNHSGIDGHAASGCSLRWNSFLFNNRGNFKSNILIRGLNHTVTDFIQILPGTQAVRIDFDTLKANQNETWQGLYEEADMSFLDIVMYYIIDNIFRIDHFSDDLEYACTRFGALDAKNNETTKYADFAVFHNYITEQKHKSLKTKAEPIGILFRLTLNNPFKGEDDFAKMSELLEQLNNGEANVIDVFDAIFSVRIIGNINSTKNVLKDQNNIFS